MKIKLIKTKSEYEAALARVEKLMDAKRGTTQGDELEVLSLLIHEYEEKIFPIAQPDPVAAIRFRMAQQGLRDKDLVPFLGSRSRVSEVLSGRRALSLRNDSRLGQGLAHSRKRVAGKDGRGLKKLSGFSSQFFASAAQFQRQVAGDVAHDDHSKARVPLNNPGKGRTFDHQQYAGLDGDGEGVARQTVQKGHLAENLSVTN